MFSASHLQRNFNNMIRKWSHMKPHPCHKLCVIINKCGVTPPLLICDLRVPVQPVLASDVLSEHDPCSSNSNVSCMTGSSGCLTAVMQCFPLCIYPNCACHLNSMLSLWLAAWTRQCELPRTCHVLPNQLSMLTSGTGIMTWMSSCQG